MQVQKIQNNQIIFGTRFGPRLTRFIENNYEVLTSDSRRNLANIRNNGIDSVLELEPATKHEQEKYNYIYKLNLHSDIVDKKNDIMRLGRSLYREFQDYVTGKYSGKVFATDNRFPIPIKNIKENTYILVTKQFEDNNMLTEKIQEEIRQAQIVNEEFNKFEKDYIKKIKGE